MNKMMLIFVLVFSLVANVWAENVENQDLAGQEAVSEINQMASPGLVEDAFDDISAWEEAMKAEFGIDDWGEKDGKFFLFGSQAVSLNTSDPQFGVALSNAFGLAVMNAQEAMLMDRYGHITVEKAREFMKDQSTNAKDIEMPSYSDREFTEKCMDLLSKSLDVASKKLDKELLDMGYSPEQVASMSPVAKKTNFLNSYISTTVKTASGDISGIVPIQSVVVIDKNGNAQVGVILVWSRKTVQIAKDISLQRPSLITGKGRDLKDMLPRNNEEKLGLRGVRLVYDESGCPVIISYGLASFVSDTDDYAINAELKQDAKNAARDMADAQIAEMVNGYMSAENMREQGEEVERYVEKEMSYDAMSVEKTVHNIIDISNRRAKSAARMKMTGISTLESKFFTLPSGQQFVYCVRAWKYSTMKAMQDLDTPISPARKTDENTKSASGASGIYGGRKMNTLEDF